MATALPDEFMDSAESRYATDTYQLLWFRTQCIIKNKTLDNFVKVNHLQMLSLLSSELLSCIMISISINLDHLVVLVYTTHHVYSIFNAANV